MTPDRRSLLKAGALGAFAYSVGGRVLMLAPRQARARNAELQIFSEKEARLLDAMGEALLPGAGEAGLVHFIDAQLAADPADSLLTLRYFDVPPPWADLYRGALAALNAAARSAYEADFNALKSGQADSLIGRLAAGELDAWDGPPQGLVFFALRSDAVDVVYGTPDGFKRLGLDYAAHISPELSW